MTLREYQREAIEQTLDWFRRYPGQRPLIVLPTGAGKTHVLAGLLQHVVSTWENQRILVLSHVKEIVEQDAEALARYGIQDIGVMCAKMNRFEGDHPVVVGSVQTARNRIDELGFRHLCVVDEAHLVPRKSGSMYQKLFQALRRVNPRLAVMGMTATAYRLDSGCMITGEDRTFDGISYDAPIDSLIEQGFLTRLVPKKPENVIDTTGVRIRGGEFRMDDLADAVDDDAVIEAAVNEIVEHGRDRRSWLVFGSGVKHSQKIAAELRRSGVHTEEIYGDTPLEERERVIDSLRRGTLKCVVNNVVLTTGFDAPNIDLIACLRPTKSPGLWVQMVGRGLRVAEHKTECLVLDFGGNTERHGPLNMIRPPNGKGEGDGTAPVKECPECHVLVFAGLRECPECGHAFPPPEVKHTTKAATDELIAKTGSTKEVNVTHAEYRVHTKGGRDMVRVEYFDGGDLGFKPVATEFVFPEHGGYAGEKFVNWWMGRTIAYSENSPDTSDEAVERANRGELRVPERLVLRREGKYWRVHRAVWSMPDSVGCYSCARLVGDICSYFEQSPPEDFRPKGCDRFVDRIAKTPF